MTVEDHSLSRADWMSSRRSDPLEMARGSIRIAVVSVLIDSKEGKSASDWLAGRRPSRFAYAPMRTTASYFRGPLKERALVGFRSSGRSYSRTPRLPTSRLMYSDIVSQASLMILALQKRQSARSWVTHVTPSRVANIHTVDTLLGDGRRHCSWLHKRPS